ncbi:MAG: hypothetical protein M1831_002958 [Alyxoria varia]|nr:MAG: hypothetical protein M1831_002958 [Alyxoria varia]
MQTANTRPPLRGGFMSAENVRPISRGSTTSHDTTNGLDSIPPLEQRYAPIRPRSHPSQESNERPISPNKTNHIGDHTGLEQIHQYNNSQNSPFGAHQVPRRYSSIPVTGLENSNNGARAAAETLVNAANLNAGRRLSQPPTTAGSDREKKDKKNASATAANEKELRELIERNWHRTLESIARDVKNSERTQKSEKAKQLFAMRWLREHCRQDKESVRRDRVYAFYAERCGRERVDTLNPASFGKLVRIIFPGIQTRRLGVRGESKYHYVNLTLVADSPKSTNGPPSIQNNPGSFMDRGTPFGQDSEFQSSRRMTDSAVFPPQENWAPVQPKKTNPRSRSKLFEYSNMSSINPETGEPYGVVDQTLSFAEVHNPTTGDQPLLLPSIDRYLPQGVDPELAHSLSVQYSTHCTSLIDAVRYVKEKQFMKLLSAFNGTLTVPVSKILDLPSIAPWIEASDTMMYQQIVRFVSQLALQVIPVQVLNMLKTISGDFGVSDQVRKNFRSHPEHVIQAKLKPAITFSRLLQRLLRVNETAHAAANLLMNDDMRNIMWKDWVEVVKPKRIVESALSTCGHEEVYYALTQEMRHLLEPLAPSNMLVVNTEFQPPTSPSEFNRSSWLHDQNLFNAETIVERWACFLRSIPTRFPSVDTRMLVRYIEAVGNAALRDITVNQVQSFGAWWITKVWVDEMMLWMAEMGGYLEEPGSPMAESPSHSDGFESFFEQPGRASARDSNASPERPESGLGIDMNPMASFAAANGESHHPNVQNASAGKQDLTTLVLPRDTDLPAAVRLTNKSPSKPESVNFELDPHDDSGIGMSLVGDPGPEIVNQMSAFPI